jgi:hypothetical protein
VGADGRLKGRQRRLPTTIWSALAAVCFLFPAAVAMARDWTPISDSLCYREIPLTDQHRYHEGVMSAHWGHHLSHLVRTHTTGLWYVDDTGNDVNWTRYARYYQLVGDSTWVKRLVLQSEGRVQQNTASLASGDTLYTYGVDVEALAIVENLVDTRSTEASTRRIRSISANTNYIGAAISPSGRRIVWWTRVVNGGPCEWNYIHNDGAGWSPTIRTSIPGRTDFSYVVSTFADSNTLWVAGEALGGGGEEPWTYALGAGSVNIGQPMEDFQLLPGDNRCAADIWYNPDSGDLHLLGAGRDHTLTYYRTRPGELWPEVADTLSIKGGAHRASRFLCTADGGLCLAIATPTGLKLKYLSKSALRTRLDIDAAPTLDIHANVGFNRTQAIFPERPEYQTAPVGEFHFAYPGNDYDHARFLQYLQIRPIAPEGRR